MHQIGLCVRIIDPIMRGLRHGTRSSRFWEAIKGHEFSPVIKEACGGNMMIRSLIARLCHKLGGWCGLHMDQRLVLMGVGFHKLGRGLTKK